MSGFEKTSGNFRHKNEMAVKLQLAGEPVIDAWIYHVNGERLTDLLNDSRAFLPVRTQSGVMIVAKLQIASIVECECEADNDDLAGANAEEPDVKPAGKSFNAYEALRITPEASLDEIRAAYKARIKTVHPDCLSSYELDDDLKKAAVLATQKVNYAYHKILRERDCGKAGVGDASVRRAAG